MKEVDHCFIEIVRFLALKGPNNEAQGIALGIGVFASAFALKGHDKQGSNARLFCPFRAEGVVGGSGPRAMPWASLFGPFRAKNYTISIKQLDHAFPICVHLCSSVANSNKLERD